MGIQSIISLSLKQNNNTKRLTEAELVGVDDDMDFVVWAKLFFNWQKSDYPKDINTKFLGQKKCYFTK